MNQIITKAMVRKILEGALQFQWSLQGLGMLRLYLSDEIRLHVWDDRFEFAGASPMHTHPWFFQSTVIAGKLLNLTYERDEGGVPYNCATIRCGSGGGLVSEPETVRLRDCRPAVYGAGESYEQQPYEIHISRPARGTVTLVERHFYEDVNHALVFWDVGTEWGSAEPRPATADEISAIVRYSLSRWFEPARRSAA